MTVGLVPSDKPLVCCEVGKNFASDLVLLLLCEKLDSAAEIGVIFFHCHSLTENQFQLFSFHPPPPTFFYCYTTVTITVCVSFLSKRVLKLEPQTFCPGNV